MRLEHRTDTRAIPPEDEVLDRPCRPNAARPKHSHALPALAPNTVVRDSVRAPLAQLGTQSLRLSVVSRRVHVFELAPLVTQIVKLRASDRSVEYLEVQVLRGRLRRLEEGDTMMLHLGDRRRLVPCGVVDA